ncbi:MAG: hypothetical protein O2819_00845 [Planctomycetota bacterium]|nr:hypothetical protein [Planctomycetota bacterium]MDA1105671.1 hypothetical protein [Planctomycetota bacterium]
MSHGHPTDAPLEVYDDPEPAQTWVASAVFVLGTVITIAAVAAAYFNIDREDVERRVVDPAFTELVDLKASQTELLTTYGTTTVEVDGKPVKKIRIPVAKAMELMVADSAKVKTVSIEGATPRTVIPATRIIPVNPNSSH